MGCIVRMFDIAESNERIDHVVVDVTFFDDVSVAVDYHNERVGRLFLHRIIPISS